MLHTYTCALYLIPSAAYIHLETHTAVRGMKTLKPEERNCFASLSPVFPSLLGILTLSPPPLEHQLKFWNSQGMMFDSIIAKFSYR